MLESFDKGEVMKKLMLLTTFFFLSGLNADCIEDLGTPNMFGSYDQLKHIQKERMSNV